MAHDDATAAYIAATAADAKPLREMTLAEMRAVTDPAGFQPDPGPEMAAVRETRIAVSGGWIPVRTLLPNAQPRGVIVHYHGGGWVLGSLDESDGIARHLAAATGCAVVDAGYRLAPEYRYPVAVDDAYTALEWVAANVEEVAGDRVPLIVAGESAGGNIAAVVTRRSFERKGPKVALQVLVYPVTDCDFDTLSYHEPDNQPLLTRDDMTWFWEQYVPIPETRKHPDASPLRFPFLTGVAPAVILTAEHDVLRDEGELYAMRLVQAGVPVEHHRFLGQAHGFFSMIGVLPGGKEGLDYVAGAIARCIERDSPAHVTAVEG